MVRNGVRQEARPERMDIAYVVIRLKATTRSATRTSVQVMSDCVTAGEGFAVDGEWSLPAGVTGRDGTDVPGSNAGAGVELEARGSVMTPPVGMAPVRKDRRAWA